MDYLGAAVTDKKYERPGNPWVCLIGDRDSELILDMGLTEPGEEGGIRLARMMVSYILTHGAPRQICVNNMMAGAALEEICQLTGTEL